MCIVRIARVRQSKIDFLYKQYCSQSLVYREWVKAILTWKYEPRVN